MKRKKWIVDTTLRDGEQCPGIAFQEEDKVRLALLLEKAGVYELEAGIADMAIENAHCVSQILSKRKTAMDLRRMLNSIYLCGRHLHYHHYIGSN